MVWLRFSKSELLFVLYLLALSECFLEYGAAEVSICENHCGYIIAFEFISFVSSQVVKIILNYRN
jgi:hypothetical protein